MNNVTNRRLNAKPSVCEAQGISCARCIMHDAGQVENPGSITRAREIFGVRYPSSGCKPMEYQFVSLVMSKPQAQVDEDDLPYILPDLGQINAIQVFGKRKRRAA